MKLKLLLGLMLFSSWVQILGSGRAGLSDLKANQEVDDFRVANLFSNADGKIVGAKFRHIPTGAPIFLMQIETVPQVFMWVDTPVNSNQGLPHSLEHLLAGKGVKGRYFSLLREMRLSQSEAATSRDFNLYGLSSATGADAFFELFHAWLDALYRPDFSDTEAETEFYHLGVASDPTNKRATLVEKGAVYEEMQATQGRYTYHYELNKRVLGQQSPLGFDSGGVPDEMRKVTPAAIRRFHADHYRLGPTTGFIFVFPPTQAVPDILQKISREFRPLPQQVPPSDQPAASQPKYAIHPTQDTEPRIYPFPATNEAGPGFVHFAWKPERASSMVDLKLLELLAQGLAGEGSLLQKSVVDSKTRPVDLGATGVGSAVSLENAPSFPVLIVEISGIPGNQISPERIKQLRQIILSKISEISQYPDQSEDLISFNKLLISYARGLHRSQRVWTQNSPGFGTRAFKSDWKAHFDQLEMDPSFVKSLSEEQVWQTIDRELKSGMNIWHGLIQQFHLLDIPFSTATAPSPRLLDEIEKRKLARVKEKVDTLKRQYGASNDQEAIARFESEELAKTSEIDKIQGAVPRPRFTKNPPLTPDEGIQYRQLRLMGSVPTIATIFDHPPTVDIGLSFDLRSIPRKYYKYLPLLPRCLDSLGLKNNTEIVPYPELLGRIQNDIYAFSVGTDLNGASNRVDLSIRASATTADEFRSALVLTRQMMQSNYLDVLNADRLRDLVASRISADDLYTKRDGWITNPAYALHYQNEPALFAVHSQPTRTHWDERLRWLLHKPVSTAEIDQLGSFAADALPALKDMTRQEMSRSLEDLKGKGLQADLIEYWKKNLPSFSEEKVIDGLRQLTKEVQEDLRTGPEKTIEDLRALQKIVLNRRTLHVDLTLSQSMLTEIRSDLISFLKSIPALPSPNAGSDPDKRTPIMERLKQQHGSLDEQFPQYVGLENPDGISGNMIVYADFPGYAQMTHESLLKMLSSTLLSSDGPQSFYVKTVERGLAYDDGITSNPGLKLLWCHANRSPDIPSLIGLLRSLAAGIRNLHDPSLVDYALRQAFPLPRSVYTFSERGRLLARDIRDGNSPETVRRFSKAILRLRTDPNLLAELTDAGASSIGGVLPDETYKDQQRATKSLFFFAGPERVLSDIEQRLPIPKLLRLWPSDFWIE